MLANLHYVKELGLRSRQTLEGGDLAEFGALLHEHWEHKKRRSCGMSTRPGSVTTARLHLRC